jgi:uncharacterized protein (TIGR02646 family)
LTFVRHLDRTAISAPTCLGRYRHGEHPWTDLARNGNDYDEVCAQLNALQKARCSYCECDLSCESGRPHVEHFHQRSRVQALTFAWGNLFRYCTHDDRCGKFKDQGAGSYAPAEIIKPDEEQPRDLLRFTSDGRAIPRAPLSAVQSRRATETIRVFALDCPGLRNMRKSYLTAIVSEFDEAVSAGFSSQELTAWLQEVAAAYAAHPFTSAVLDVLGL